jgi:hypothetical protein
VDLYGCETLWSECEVLEKRISRRIFGSALETKPKKMEEVLNKKVLKSGI